MMQFKSCGTPSKTLTQYDKISENFFMVILFISALLYQATIVNL